MTTTLIRTSTADLMSSEPAAERQVDVDLLKVAAHDLRSPLTVILGHLDLLRLPAAGHSVPVALDAIQRSAERMLETVRTVLEGAPAAVTPATEPLRLAPLCRQVVADVQLTHPGRRIVIHPSADAFVVADRCSVERILANLVRNAVIHTTPDTTIDLLIAPGHDASSVSIFVRDDGPGIAEARRASVFEPYERGDTEADGTGLGLSISRDLARSLGGDLVLLDRTGPGCCFELRLVRIPRRG